MRIKQINDEAARERQRPIAAIKVWRGTPKIWNSKRERLCQGNDLKTKFRIETKEPMVASSLAQAYGTSVIKFDTKEPLRRGAGTKKVDCVIVDHLNIGLAYEDPLKTFTSTMIRFDKGQIKSKCDGQTIYCEYEQKTDQFKNTRTVPVDCSKPCKLQNGTCPSGCIKSGTFYFYILELIDLGIERLCSLTIHGENDLKANGFARQIDELPEKFPESIKYSALPVAGGFIPYVLSRRLAVISRPEIVGKRRTGKMLKGEAGLLQLDVNPNWLRAYDEFKRLSCIAQLKATLTGEENIQALQALNQVRKVPALKASETTAHQKPSSIAIKKVDSVLTINEQQWEVLRSRAKENGWRANSLTSLLKDFGYSRASEISLNDYGRLMDTVGEPPTIHSALLN